MAITQRTLVAQRQMRAEVDREVDTALAAIAAAYGAAWDDIKPEWVLAIAALIELGDGDWPTTTAIRQSQRVENALKLTREALNELRQISHTAAAVPLRDLVELSDEWTEAVAKAQLPADYDLPWNRPPRKEVTAIVNRARTRIHSRNWPLSRQAERQMKAALVRGVIVGDNPRKAAARMLAKVNGRFNGGLARAQNIAATEMLDAHRYAAQASRAENRAVLDGWYWLATLDKRTCPSCLAKNGNKYSTDDFGPQDHQRGRCTAVAVVRTWRSLGISGVDEPADTIPDAREWFAKQPRADREQIMGKERLRQFEDGRIGWQHMSQRVPNNDWRTSYHVRALPR